jgi:pentapeptide repeat protein
MASTAVALRMRWMQPPWRDAATRVFRTLRRGKRLRSLHLPTHDGRIDLRGLPLPQPVPKGRINLPSTGPSVPDFEFTLIGGRFETADVSLKSVDLSFSDLSQAVWLDCSFEDSLLRGAIVFGGFFRNCDFRNVVFDEADLQHTLVGGCGFPSRRRGRRGRGVRITSFNRTSFVSADLRHTYYQYPVF